MKKQYPRHPEIDKCWENHQRLVWWLDKKLRRRWYGFNAVQGHFAGWLYELMNYCLYFWKPGREAKFSSYFIRSALRGSWRHVRNDDEWLTFSRHVGVNRRQKRSGKEPMLLEWADKELSEQEHRQKHLESWTEEFFRLFPEEGELWNWLVKPFDNRKRTLARLRWSKDGTLQKAGNHLGVTRERIRQLEDKMLNVMRDRLGSEERWEHTWRKPT